ncbi:hypothetical protein [Streptomyces sp. NBC_00057]|uniref:hypothetical protein n=1 Tax=Streptomyces sp. NBC_00057 TaxID=2975634 RepID=UPI0032556FD9
MTTRTVAPSPSSARRKFRTLRTWTRDHAYGNASFRQFEALAARDSGKDLKGFFGAWVDGTVIPPEKYLYPGSLGTPTR